MAFLGLILLFIECFLGGFLIAYFLCSDGGSCKTNVFLETGKDNEKEEELTEVTVETNGPEQFEKTSSSDAKQQQLED